MSDEHRSAQRLAKSLAALTVGEPQAHEEREAALYPDRATDMAICMQSLVQGATSDTPVWAEMTVAFPYPFIMASDPGKGDGNLGRPTVSFGLESQAGDQGAFIQASVAGWVRDDRDFYTGCTIRVGAFIPGAEGPGQFVATLHMTFMGYAAPSEDDDLEAT